MESSAERNEQIASFVEVVGESIEKARQFLQATNWKLDEAIELFYAHPDTQLPSVSPSVTQQERQSHEIDPDYVRPPLPVRREALYDQRSAQWSTQPASSNWGFWDKGNDRLEALYRPPLELMFKGSFEQAKSEAARQGKWVIANIQSPKEFSSYMLNRDTWANQAVRETITATFIFLQIHDDNDEGRKLCTYYRLTEMPSTLVIDSITGQKMQAWTGMINPERLLEDLIPFMENGPKEYSHSRRAREVEARGKALAVFASLDIKEEDNQQNAVKREYPKLPEEPEGGKGVNICRICVRLPDGRRVQRKFLQSDPIQLLWSFCSSQLKEAADGRQFRLANAIPGASAGILDYDTNVSFADSGVSNSLISMTWE